MDDTTRRLDWDTDVVAVQDSDNDEEVHVYNPAQAPRRPGPVPSSSQSLPPPLSTAASTTTTTTTSTYTYVEDDHTQAAPSSRFHNPTHTSKAPKHGSYTGSSADDGPIRRKVVILPSTVPPAVHTSQGVVDGQEEITPRTSTTVAAAVEASGGAGGGAPTPAGASAAKGAAVTAGGQALPYVLVRLPHPKHGQPNLYLCPRRSEAELIVMEQGKGRKGACRATLTHHLCELQAQAPPGGYAQTWFLEYEGTPMEGGVGHATRVEEVLPCNDILVATPVHLTFMAIHALEQATRATEEAEEGQNKGRFMSAEDLFSAENHQSGGTTGPGARHDAYNANVDFGGTTDDTPFPFGEPVDFFATTNDSGAGDDDMCGAHRQRKAARVESPPAAKGWLDWPSAVQACPHLLPCWHALTSRDCLSPICEEKEAGGTTYYRFHRSKAVAWLAARVRAVQASAALRRVLQLEATSATAGNGPVSAPPAEVPMGVAFDVVSEYIPESLATAVSAACGIVNNNDNTKGRSSGGSSKAGPALAPVGSVHGEASSATAKASAAPAVKSASVKRLEKAGRPKGTPTLFAMFAKKPPS